MISAVIFNIHLFYIHYINRTILSENSVLFPLTYMDIYVIIQNVKLPLGGIQNA